MKNTKKDKIKNSLSFDFYSPEFKSKQELELYSNQIPAGFPSPADDFLEKRLDLNDYLIKNKTATFLIKVRGNSMIKAGIFNEDILIIDRSVEPVEGKIILGILNGEFTVKRIVMNGKQLLLMPENDEFEPIVVTEEMDFQIWGVVTFAIHKM